MHCTACACVAHKECIIVCLSVPQSIWLQCTNANGASIRMSMGKALPSGYSRVYLLQPEASPRWMNSGPSEKLSRLPWTTHACVFSVWMYVFLKLRVKECPLQWVCMWKTWQEMMASPIHVSHVNNLCLSRLLCISCKSTIPFFLVHSALHVVDIEGDRRRWWLDECMCCKSTRLVFLVLSACRRRGMRRLRLVNSLTRWVCFVKEPYQINNILQKRHVY